MNLTDVLLLIIAIELGLILVLAVVRGRIP